jgi:ABC-2 type transport system ATP-binding protein
VLLLDTMIEVKGVSKRFGPTVALANVDLTAETAKVLALLGPNGAGKTTLVRILTTLLLPDAGWAKVAGYDVVKQATQLRSVIGLAGQSAAVDEVLTGRENLELVGRLYHLTKSVRRQRAQDVLELFSLTDAGDRQVNTYSGGMRRRLDVGASLVARPPVLLLDEPTTGLDPRSRIDLWEFIESLVRDGTTVLLTTQYLEEADRLADKIVVLDVGRVIAEGTSDELKDRLGGDRLEIRVTDQARFEEAVVLMAGLDSGSTPQTDLTERRISIPTRKGPLALMTAARRFEDAGIALDDVSLRRPSLDDVFLAVTGHAAAVEAEAEPSANRRRRRRNS